VSDLSLLTRSVTYVLTSTSPVLSGFDLGLVSALLDGDDAGATTVLDEMVKSGLAVQSDHGGYTIAGSTAAGLVRDEPPAAAEDTGRRLLVLLAVQADLTLDPFAPRLSTAYEIPVASPFATPADAMVWFEPNHTRLMELLDELFARRSYKLCVTLAEALLGLAGRGGYLQDQVQIATTALEALGCDRFGPGLFEDRGSGVARGRDYDMAVAAFNLMLASAWCNLHGYSSALQAIDLAVDHARKADSERLVAAAHRCRAITHLAEGKLSDAESEVLLALELDEASDDGLRLYLCQWIFANILAALGRHIEARAEFDRAADRASDLGHAVAYARVLTDHGAALTAAGESMNAIAVLTTALMALKREETGSDAWLGDTYRNLALAWRAAGDLTRADECFHQAIERYRLARRQHAADEVEREWRRR
jgi:tetratricopeptide (TPR) repeat protein